jgi:preprotein translocase subunit SecF
MNTKFAFKFIEKKNLWFMLSIAFIILGMSLVVSRYFKAQPILNYGIDFVGGHSMILKFEELDNLHAANQKKGVSRRDTNVAFIGRVREELKAFGLEKTAIRITQEREVLIKTLALENELSSKVRHGLKKSFGQVEVLEIDYIGPTIGQELKEQSLWIILVASVALLLYITWRFEFIFGLAALIALLHDAFITLSFASLANIEIDTAFVAAILTILGYSINDTIVIFDRIRENVPKLAETTSLAQIANISLNQTLVRTINTSLTTITVITCLLVFGGTTIKSFCLILLVGIISGTYSSLFIASPILVKLHPGYEVES